MRFSLTRYHAGLALGLLLPIVSGAVAIEVGTSMIELEPFDGSIVGSPASVFWGLLFAWWAGLATIPIGRRIARIADELADILSAAEFPAPPELESDVDREGRRGQVQLVDVVMTFFLLVAYLVLYPFYSHFIDLVVAEADPFSSLLLRLTLAVIPLALIISVGVSARRGGI